MAIHHLGYRAWTAERVFWRRQPVVIAATGVRRAWQSAWLRRMLFLAWLPAVWFASGFFIWEQALQYPDMAGVMQLFLEEAAPKFRESVNAALESDDASQARHSVWAYFLFSFFRYSQAFLMLIVVGLVAPPMISQDIRSRAFLVYFSQPIARWQYVLGKLSTVWFYLILISTLPALTLYSLGVLLSPQLVVVQATWDLPLRVLIASVALSLPTAALALCISSLTQESRHATFAWFAIWVLGWVAFGSLTSVETARHGDLDAAMQQWSIVSLYHILGRVQAWIFGFADLPEVVWPLVILSVITVLSLAVLTRRVTAPMRV